MNSVHRKFPSRAVCALALTLLFAGCDLFTGADDRRARASSLLAAGDYSAALVELKNVLADKPGDAEALLMVARASMQLGSIDAAAKALEDAATAGADARAVRTLRAQGLLRAGKYPQLLALLDAPGPAPDDASTLRIQALGGLNRCADAVTLAREQLKQKADNAPARVVIAECYARHGAPARALRELDAAVKISPSTADAWMALGRAQQLSGKLAEAEASWDQAALHAPGQLGVAQQAMLYSALADVQIARDEPEALAATHARLLKLAPQATFTELVGARLLLMQGKLDAAVTSLRNLLVAAPDVGAVHLLLSSAHLAQGNIEQARQELAWTQQHAPEPARDERLRASVAAAEHAPRDSRDYWLNLGIAQSQLGQYDQARRAFAKADDTKDIRPALALARMELSVGNVERARGLLARVKPLHAQEPAVILLEADLKAAAGEFAAADALLRDLYARSPSGPLALAQYRVRMQGRLPDAIAPLQKWVEANPRDGVMRAYYADAARAAGDQRRAIIEYERLVAAAPRSVVFLNNLAWLYHLENDPRALATAKRAWQLAPQLPEVADTYGWLLVESGSIDQGVQILSATDEVAGVARPEIRYHLVQALARQGQRAQARTLLAALMAESPESPSEAEASRLLATLAEPGAT